MKKPFEWMKVKHKQAGKLESFFVNFVRTEMLEVHHNLQMCNSVTRNVHRGCECDHKKSKHFWAWEV